MCTATLIKTKPFLDSTYSRDSEYITTTDIKNTNKGKVHNNIQYTKSLANRENHKIHKYNCKKEQTKLMHIHTNIMYISPIDDRTHM